MLPAAPDWASGMERYRWYRISGDAPDLGLPPTDPGTRYLVDNDPNLDPRLNPPHSLKERLRRMAGRAPRSPWHGTMGITAMTECWNGAVLASRLGASGSMVCFGGGHNDYFGSDVHRFDLATRGWSRILDGYVDGDADAYGEGAVYEASVYPDGSPLPPHTYDYVQYDPEGNDLLLLKGQRELGPHVQAVPIPHMLNLDSLEWRHGPRHPDARLNSGGWTTWDPGRGRLWGHSGDDGGGNGLTWFEPSGDAHDGSYGRWGPRYPNKLPDIANHNAMRLDPHRDLILVSAHGMDAMLMLDPERPDAPLTTVSASGARPALMPYAALEFSMRLDCFVYFCGRSGAAIHLLQAPTDDKRSCGVGRWRWEERTPPEESLDPIRDAAMHSTRVAHPDHVFGRFRLVEYGDADPMTLAILVRHVDSPVYAMRLI